jgi:chemotaxis signal transduction protein
MNLPETSEAALALRRAFDESFQKPVAREREREEEILLVRAGESLLAVRTAETAGVLRCPRITPVPGPSSELLGICGLRGSVVAAYGLAALLGIPGGRTGEWMFLSIRDRTVGVVFDELEGCRRVPLREFRSSHDVASGLTPGIVVVAGESRALIRISSLHERIDGRPRRGDSNKE